MIQDPPEGATSVNLQDAYSKLLPPSSQSKQREYERTTYIVTRHKEREVLQALNRVKPLPVLCVPSGEDKYKVVFASVSQKKQFIKLKYIQIGGDSIPTTIMQEMYKYVLRIYSLPTYQEFINSVIEGREADREDGDHRILSAKASQVGDILTGHIHIITNFRLSYYITIAGSKVRALPTTKTAPSSIPASMWRVMGAWGQPPPSATPATPKEKDPAPQQEVHSSPSSGKSWCDMVEEEEQGNKGNDVTVDNCSDTVVDHSPINSQSTIPISQAVYKQLTTPTKEYNSSPSYSPSSFVPSSVPEQSSIVVPSTPEDGEIAPGYDDQHPKLSLHFEGDDNECNDFNLASASCAPPSSEQVGGNSVNNGGDNSKSAEFKAKSQAILSILASVENHPNSDQSITPPQAETTPKDSTDDNGPTLRRSSRQRKKDKKKKSSTSSSNDQ